MNNSILLIDVGNTAVKWQFKSQLKSIATKRFNIGLLPQAAQIFVSCVGDKSLLNNLDAVFFESPAEFNDFKSSYQTPSDLGFDRFLAMIAAMMRYPNQTLLVVDAGSALTFDLVLANGKHQGGLIMPGLSKLRSSFNQFSTNSQQLDPPQLANNTEQSWLFGTGQMLVDSIDAQIQRYSVEFGDLRIVFTGGDANAAMLRLNHTINLHQNLVLEGLSIYTQTRTV